MLIIFILAVLASILISFFCSMAEAAIFAISLPLVRHVAKSGSRSAKILLNFKNDIGRPISAILILNTISHTCGAAVAGAQAIALWGEFGLFVFSILFTFAILIFSEILPKILGATYPKQVSLAMALPLTFFIYLFYPIVSLTKWITDRVESKSEQPRISEEEVLSMAAIGTEEGTLDVFEGSVISNVMRLNDTLVRDILTPRVTLFKLPDCTKVGEIKDKISLWKYTRVPLHVAGDHDHLTSYVIHRDILRAMLRKQFDLPLSELARPLPILPELTTVDRVLKYMFENKDHICGLVDEHGALAGIVTLEDIIEEIVGREIEDEYDTEGEKSYE